MAGINPSSAVVQEIVFDALATITGVEETRSAPDLKIRELGLLDSLGLISLIVALSKKLDVEIAPGEIEESNVATPRAIVEFVQQKLEAQIR